MTVGLAEAVAHLTSLHEGYAGVPEVVACGAQAIPALRGILFTRDPSGFYETRRRAAEALGQLHADDVLAEYLLNPPIVTDPVEWTGEEAVINAVARALGDSADPRALHVLLAMTRKRPFAGVVDALGKHGRPEALPYFIAALADDFVRPAAEAAIRGLGVRAQRALLRAALSRNPPDGAECESSTRFRRSALALYASLRPVPRADWPAIARLADDTDPDIAATACRLWLDAGDPASRATPLRRLLALRAHAGWLLAADIDECLADHADDAASLTHAAPSAAGEIAFGR